MKKILFVILFTMLCGQVFATDILDNFRDYRYAIKLGLGLDTNSSTYADTTVNRQIRESVATINPLIKFRLREFSFLTTYKNNKYTLDSTILGIESVEWKKIDSVKSLVYAPRNSWYQLPIKQTQDEPSAYLRRPSYYDYTDSLIFLHPPPVEIGDTIRILAWAKFPNETAGDSLLRIPQEYRNVIKYHAIYELAKSRQHPLTNIFKSDFNEAVAILNRIYGRNVPQVTPNK